MFLRFDDSHTEFRCLVYDQVDQAAKRNVDEILVIAFSQVDLLLAVRPAGADIDGVMPSFVKKSDQFLADFVQFVIEESLSQCRQVAEFFDEPLYFDLMVRPALLAFFSMPTIAPARRLAVCCTID